MSKIKEKKQYFIFKDNGTALWTDPVHAESEQEAVEKASLMFNQLTASQKEGFRSFLLCEGSDGSEICGGFYEDDDSEGSWIIEKEICDFMKNLKE